MDKAQLKKEPLGKGVFVKVSKNHTFGTDAILLANFAKPRKNDRCVDLGSGCGIIPLLMLRDNPDLITAGVEISEEACFLAEASKDEQNFPNFSIINSDLKDLKGKIEFGAHTLITCNPPYNASGSGIESKNEREKVARHEIACTLEDIVSVSSRLLQTSGRLCICLRPERLAELISLMRDYKIEPKKLRFVCKTPDTAPWLFLIEGKKCAKSGMVVEKSLFINDNSGNFSREMIDIYGSYKEAYL
ncbi:MAG: methyltransferase [Clostridiales bacterium]|nr:methyltransferase [Candidatus Equinaster intestinalis]